MRLFLLIGQSNMAGRGPVEERDRVPHPGIKSLNADLQWVPAVDPLHFDSPTIVGVGLASRFARTLAGQDSSPDPSITIGLIPCAVGGTTLEQWKPGGELYSNAVNRTHAAQKDGTLAGILWHQGENDVEAGTVDTYVERFVPMVAQLRADLNAENVPLVIGELGHFFEGGPEFNTILPEITRRVPLCTWVSAEGLTHKGDDVHFDSASLRTLGERYAAAFSTLAGD